MVSKVSSRPGAYDISTSDAESIVLARESTCGNDRFIHHISMASMVTSISEAYDMSILNAETKTIFLEYLDGKHSHFWICMLWYEHNRCGDTDHSVRASRWQA